ncbi:unnamed protein product [Rotaria socialis]|uniref:Uncharacterized protein n=1 Tax=Rotaria socialis TaxID=392032 RepID=A0A821AJ50_9BILA|nr:unnamed protein product [Rotaria socialis]CAF4574929.1 unnamed protein product [Rotaria socialis]
MYYTRSTVQDNIQDVKYCRQLNESQVLHRDFNQSCHKSGILWSFKELSLLKVSTSDVLQWSASMEQADRYSEYLSNSSLDTANQYICNCTNLASFGKFCEYEFYGNTTSFNDAMENQFKPFKDKNTYFDNRFLGSQLHNNRPCYTTWICDSGLMCLDWRHICDGKQQCMDGLDEDYCETLEFNECEDDEYRCTNGMCIPEQYWLDGDYDCMDWTDEMNIIVESGENCIDKSSYVCDEHLCPYNQWPCGDGQCVNDETDRHDGLRFNENAFCRNMRDANYMCEAVTRDNKLWWTIDGGYCLPYSLPYQTLSLDTTAITNKCGFLVKCSLSNSLDQDCECNSTVACRKMVNGSCSESYLPYPHSGFLISGYIGMMYERDRDWAKKEPDRLLYRGRMKCIGYQLITKGIRRFTNNGPFKFYRYRLSERRLCNMQEEVQSIRNYSGPHYHVNCWNSSKTFNNRPYQVSLWCETRCISKYRVRDGIYDCQESEENSTTNNSCPQIQRHRLQCSSSQLSCLLASELGNWMAACSNERDEFDYESETVLARNIACEQRTDPGCVYLRNYIRISSYTDINKITIANNSILYDQSTKIIPFRSYCNSFFDIKSGIDESPQFCKEWTCFRSEYQCLSGQCISTDWICDGEWDCSDGSDEQHIFIMDSLNKHNSQLMNLTQMKTQCYQQYRRNNTPFFEICNITSEYPCFLTGVSDPFNFTSNRPCINLTQIGDEKIDCLSGLDERNLLQCSNHGMLGFHFQFDNNICGVYHKLCINYPWIPGANVAYDTVCFHQRKQFKNGTDSKCNGIKDVMCLNDVCLKNARCNGNIDCLHGEDEYRCISQGISQLDYREGKKSIQTIRLMLRSYPSLINYVHHYNSTHLGIPLSVKTRNKQLSIRKKPKSADNRTIVNGRRDSTVKTVYEIVRDSLPTGMITFEEHYLPFFCNRGVAVKYYTDNTVCFCPPSYYGSECEFHSDRITVETHLDLSNYRATSDQITVIKVLVTFLFEELIIDYHEFHVNPQIENENNYIKQGIYFLYPRTETFIQIKNNNRSGTQLYSVRFEAFDLYVNGTVEPIGVWHYPIYFDFLPAFRLSKILRFNRPISSHLSGPCYHNLCGKNGICLEVINSNRSSYFCSCNSAYYGIHCENYAEECTNYCSLESICKPKHGGILTGNQQLLCLCPSSTFGDRCYLKNHECKENPCMNEGSCVVAYDLTDPKKYICLCPDLFTGAHCEFSKQMVNIALAVSLNSTLQTIDILAVTVMYNNYDNESLRFDVRHQQVYDGLPSQLRLINNDKVDPYVPRTAILKVYTSKYRSEEPAYYILYFLPFQENINITVYLTSERHCPLVKTTEIPGSSGNSTLNSTTAIFYYHHICRVKQNTNTVFTCFRDQNYLCICEDDHYRAECFGYNRLLDQCSLCLSNGYCLKGELQEKADYLCLCPRCHHGRRCQYSTEAMSFTLDSLIVKDIQNNPRLSTGFYILITIIMFLFGFFNNFCTFLTFTRQNQRRVSVEIYLLIIAIVDQCSMLFLLLKVIHIILGSNGSLFHYENLNLYACKVLSYLLSVFTRITYWLTSFVTVERLCIVLFPTSVTVTKSRRTLVLSICLIFTVGVMHVHEVLYYTTIVDPSYTFVNFTLCVSSYAQSYVSTYNRANILIHYFIPFFIQFISITVLIIQLACSRARISGGSSRKSFVDLFKRQFKEQKEQYATPMIIILSSLPQAILSFSYACTELKQSWQQYSLLTAYFLSYLPQVLGFFLYVLPSTVYSKKFRQTFIGKRLMRQERASATRQQNPKKNTS